jgi:hypothetical protein
VEVQSPESKVQSLNEDENENEDEAEARVKELIPENL